MSTEIKSPAIADKLRQFTSAVILNSNCHVNLPTQNHVIQSLPLDENRSGNARNATYCRNYQQVSILPVFATAPFMRIKKKGLMEKEVIRSLGNKNLAACIDWCRELLLFQMLL